MNQKFIRYFSNVAEVTSKLSHAKKLRVGCIIVKDNRILSVGYNGTPSGWDNECENIISDVWEEPDLHNLETKPEVLHAEANALMKLCSSTESSKDADLFITHAPCMHCAKLIYQAGIKNVYYINEYRSDEGIRFLEKSGVKVCRVG